MILKEAKSKNSCEQHLPPRKTRIDILKHFHHLILIPEQEHTSIFSRFALNLSDNCVYNGSFERIGRVSATATGRTRVQHVGLVNNEHFPYGAR